MNETTFENAVVGDRVWSILKGWGEVTKVTKEGLLYVTFSSEMWKNNPHEDTECYYVDGRLSRVDPQTLFWDEIKIVAPHKPKPREPRKCFGLEDANGKIVFRTSDEFNADAYLLNSMTPLKKITYVEVTG